MRFISGGVLLGNFGVRLGWLVEGGCFYCYFSLVVGEVEVDVELVEVDVLVEGEVSVFEVDCEVSFGFLKILGLKDEKLMCLVRKYFMVMFRSFKDGMLLLL